MPTGKGDVKSIKQKKEGSPMTTKKKFKGVPAYMRTDKFSGGIPGDSNQLREAVCGTSRKKGKHRHQK